MAYLELSTGQVDANSPVNATLMGQVRTNQVYFEAEKLNRDGSVAMTGTLNLGTNGIIGVTFIDGTGDFTMGTITMTAGSGTGIDTNGKDIIAEDIQCQDLNVLGIASFPNMTISEIMLSQVGDTETAAAGVLKETHGAGEMDFTSYVVGHYAWVPGVDAYATYYVSALTDTDNIVVRDSSFSLSKADRSMGNGNRFMLLDGDQVPISVFSFSSGAYGGGAIWTQSIVGDIGNLTRSWVRVVFSYQGTGARTLTVTYAGSTLIPVDNTSTNATAEEFVFAMAPGTNDMIFTWDSNITTFEAEIFVDHGLRISQSTIPGA